MNVVCQEVIVTAWHVLRLTLLFLSSFFKRSSKVLDESQADLMRQIPSWRRLPPEKQRLLTQSRPLRSSGLEDILAPAHAVNLDAEFEAIPTNHASKDTVELPNWHKNRYNNILPNVHSQAWRQQHID